MNSFTINSEAVSSTNKQCSLDLEVFMTNLANGTYWAAQSKYLGNRYVFMNEPREVGFSAQPRLVEVVGSWFKVQRM